jgi:hypothetical protein
MGKENFMDDRRFDSFVKTLTTGGSRRAVLGMVGGGALTALTGRFVATEDVEAKKKHHKKKKCKGGTRKCNGKCIPAADCCVDGDCAPGQNCDGGQCVGVVAECQNDGDCDAGEACLNGTCVPGNGACQDAGDCAANESCIAGQCRCVFPEKPCGDVCCASDEACVNGQCVVGQGTCAAGQSICNGNDITCNGAVNCFCADRLDDGEPRCVEFINDSRDNCTCSNDFQCEQDFPNQGAICIKGGASCTCKLEQEGRCAVLCPIQ